MQSSSTSNLKKETSVDIKNSCFSLGSVNSNKTMVNKKPKSTKFLQMIRRIPHPSFFKKITSTEDGEQGEELKKVPSRFQEMEAKSEYDFKRRLQDSPLYENAEISDSRVMRRQSQLSPFIQSNVDISKYPQTEQSMAVLPNMSLYSFLPNLLDKRHSSTVDCMGSTSVDGRVPWYSGVKFSSANQRKISSYIDKRFSSVNGRRISQFHGRKKYEKNSFVELQESVSSASANDHRLSTLKSAGYFGKPVKLRNFLDETTYIDTLHIDTFTTLGCNSHRCLGAVKSEFTSADVLRKREDVISHAMDFLDQFYSSIKKHFTSEHKARAQQVQLSVAKTGTYELTRYELTFGAKMAWRNAQRCIGRIQWAKLQVFDARGAVTAADMFEALCQHIRYATNKGNIRSTLTVFQQHIDDRDDYRIWNSYLISYAGYLLEDGTFVGDPKNLYFTEECTKLGWLPKYGHFDLLPIVVSAPGLEAEWFDIPEDIVLEVQMSHPEYKWFSDLGLKWYALPIISGMKLDCGGVLFTACAFNGWHLGTQIGSRCFCDHHRYNIIPKANVAITDHHGASDAFLYHLEIEYLVRGGCPADWKYIVPPLTPSTLGVFHQEMLMYKLKPSFEHQPFICFGEERGREVWGAHGMLGLRASSPTPGRRKSSDRRGSLSTSMASPKRFAKVKNLLDEKTYVDTLHQKAISAVPCSSERCMGSLMSMQAHRPPGAPRTSEELLLHAKDFIEQYYTSIKKNNTAVHFKRWTEVQESVDKTGTYDLTTAELTFGAKLGWRNSPRCIGRIQWSKLQVFDARHILTARGMFEALCNHIKYATNKGNLRSAITIFPQRKEGRRDFRVWNAQLIRYAGYKMDDGKIIGDPANVEFTEQCVKLGWKPKYGQFDVLPLVLSAAGSDPEWFEIPSELIIEVNFRHPKYPWFADLGLKWYALPAVSGLLFDCGGLEFPSCPFNGWYMGTEIGCRDLCDTNRYNMLEETANFKKTWTFEQLEPASVAGLTYVTFPSPDQTVDGYTVTALHKSTTVKNFQGAPRDGPGPNIRAGVSPERGGDEVRLNLTSPGSFHVILADKPVQVARGSRRVRRSTGPPAPRLTCAA
ncbi:hypothetical protein Btru_038801 [Bulinus truncatus]|nr:hypothetical protein Btru_038801 [Bulinus truncatus]